MSAAANPATPPRSAAHPRPSTRRTRRPLAVAVSAVALTAGLSLAATALPATAAGAQPATVTAATPAALRAASTTAGDFSGDGRADLLARTPAGNLYLYRGTGSGGFLAGHSLIGTGWGAFDKVLAPGDFDGDGHPDVLAHTAAGDLYLYRGNGTGGFLAPGRLIGTGWTFDRLFSPGDFTGDGHPDVLARVKGGALYLYRGNGTGGFLAGHSLVGAGWNAFDKLFSPGDFTGDGRADVIGRTPSGYLYLYRGTGTGGFQAGHTVIGAGWSSFDKLFSPGDFTGDGRADVIGRTTTGYLYLYRGTGAGGFQAGHTVIGTGWRGFNLLAGRG